MWDSESLGASSPEEGLPAAWGWVSMHLSGAGNGGGENLHESLSLGAGVRESPSPARGPAGCSRTQVGPLDVPPSVAFPSPSLQALTTCGE